MAMKRLPVLNGHIDRTSQMDMHFTWAIRVLPPGSLITPSVPVRNARRWDLTLEPWSQNQEEAEMTYGPNTRLSRILKVSDESKRLCAGDTCLIVGTSEARWAWVILWKERLWSLSTLDLEDVMSYVNP